MVLVRLLASPRRDVRQIAEFVDRRAYARLRALVDLARAVDDPAHRGGGDAGKFCHIGDSCTVARNGSGHENRSLPGWKLAGPLKATAAETDRKPNLENVSAYIVWSDASVPESPASVNCAFFGSCDLY